MDADTQKGFKCVTICNLRIDDVHTNISKLSTRQHLFAQKITGSVFSRFIALRLGGLLNSTPKVYLSAALGA